MLPTIKSGKLVTGDDFQCGENVVVNVAEEVVVGDRCVVPDNAYFSGRRVEIGSDFYGYSWDWSRLDIGRGRLDEEDAILKVGSRCTFHNNRIDLARHVTIGDDVGLSPDVVIYTHGYWQSPLEGYPMNYDHVEIGNNVIIGFRSVLLPGCVIGDDVVVGAQSVVPGGYIFDGLIVGGNPARIIRQIRPLDNVDSEIMVMLALIRMYIKSCTYRNIQSNFREVKYPIILFGNCCLNVET